MGNDIDAMCGIGDVDEIISIGMEILPQCLARLFQESIEFTAKKKDRLALQTQLPILVSLKNWLGCCSKRTMVEKMNFGVEQEK